LEKAKECESGGPEGYFPYNLSREKDPIFCIPQLSSDPRTETAEIERRGLRRSIEGGTYIFSVNRSRENVA
jgi:hypothetical protein